MKPKILIIIDQLDIGGAEIFVLNLYKQLSNDFEIHFLTLKKGRSEFVNKAKKYAKKVTVLDLNFKVPFFNVSAIKKVIIKTKPAIIHTHLTYSDIYGRIAADSAGIKNVFSTIHSIEPWRGKYFNLTGLRMALLDRYLAKKSKKIIAISKQMKKLLIEKERIPPKKISLIYNGVDTIKFRPKEKNRALIQKLNLKDKKIIGFIGRLEKPKGLPYLIKAMRGLKNAVLLIIGEGSMEDELKSLVETNKLEKKVIFLGRKYNTIDYFNLFDVFVLASLWEGLPISLLEAMACRKKIIATNISGVKEVIKNNKEGLLVISRNSKAINKALLRLINNPKDSEIMAQSAQMRAQESFSLNKSINKYKKLYFSLLKTKV